jgi:AcrR family transcriptional regulator
MTSIDPRGVATKARILGAALHESEKSNYATVTVADIIRTAEVAVGTFHYHFATIQYMRDVIMSHAIKYQIYQIVAQGIAANHPLCKNLSTEYKTKALNTLAQK